MKPLTILLEGEVGRANRPLTPIADRNYHVLGARVQYKLKNLMFTAATHENYNTNSAVVSTFASHTRSYSVTPPGHLGAGSPWTAVIRNFT